MVTRKVLSPPVRSHESNGGVLVKQGSFWSRCTPKRSGKTDGPINERRYPLQKITTIRHCVSGSVKYRWRYKRRYTEIRSGGTGVRKLTKGKSEDWWVGPLNGQRYSSR